MVDIHPERVPRKEGKRLGVGVLDLLRITLVGFSILVILMGIGEVNFWVRNHALFMPGYLDFGFVAALLVCLILYLLLRSGERPAPEM